MSIVRTARAALLLLIALPAVVTAAVTASVDRPTVDLNESFTLEIVVETIVPPNSIWEN